MIATADDTGKVSPVSARVKARSRHSRSASSGQQTATIWLWSNASGGASPGANQRTPPAVSEVAAVAGWTIAHITTESVYPRGSRCGSSNTVS